MVVVSFVPPVSNGGRSITTYTATCTSSNGGTRRVASRAKSPITVTGATARKSYRCSVKATNVKGNGPSSTASAAVVVGAPGSPTAVKITKPAAGSLKVSYKLPPNNGAPITLNTATCKSSNGGVLKSKSGSGTATSIIVTGLTGGKTYSCTVTAKNSRGAGPASAASSALKA